MNNCINCGFNSESLETFRNHSCRTLINYKGRVWTCGNHHSKIVSIILEGKEKEAQALVDILNPRKSKGICAECKRLYVETPPMNR